MRKLHIDFETFCELDIKKVGLDRYVRHKSFEVLMVSYSLDGGTVQLIDYTENPEASVPFYSLCRHNVLIYAFNAAFERAVLKFGFAIDLPPECFRCTMYHAYHLGFTGTLADVGAQMGIGEGKAKLAEGQQLIRRFCQPAPSNVQVVDRYDRHNSPQEWQRFKEYCIRDTVAEMAVEKFAEKHYPLPQEEWDLWCLDQRINERGLPVDLKLVGNALTVFKDEQKHLKEKMQQITGLDNPNSRDQLLKWLHSNQCPLPNLQAQTVADWLAHNSTDGKASEVLKLRQQSAKSAGTKWSAFNEYTDKNTGRLRGAFQAYGASRTGRWAGRGPQPHNLHTSPEDQNLKVQALETGNRTLVEAIWDNPMQVVASCVRSAITASPGSKLVVSDYHSIENIVLGYLCNCDHINAIVRQGLDPYRVFAAQMFNISYDDVTKSQRKFAKPPVLGCGYMLSGNGLVEYADGMGVEMTRKQAFHAVRLWRSLHPEVVDMWGWLRDTAAWVIRLCDLQKGYGVTIWRDSRFLFIELPSGRRLAYDRPKVTPDKRIEYVDEHGETKEFYTTSISYRGTKENHQWGEVFTHGGKLTENIVQAVAADVLRDGLFNATAAGHAVCGHVHDEIIAEHTNSWASPEDELKDLELLMSKPPAWAPGLMLRAEGYVSQRYRKE